MPMFPRLIGTFSNGQRSCDLDQVSLELDTAAAAGMSEFGKLVAMAGKYGITIEPPTA